MNTELRRYFKKIGRKGGQTTLKRYGLAKMTRWGKNGGRPKKVGK